MGLYILRLIVLLVCAWSGAVIGLTWGSPASGLIGAAVVDFSSGACQACPRAGRIDSHDARLWWIQPTELLDA